jgi:integrase
MNINYYYYIDLKTNNPEKIIFLDVRFKNTRFRLHTGERIAEKYWEKKNQKAKRSYPGHSELNYFLDAYKNRIKNIVRKIRTDDPLMTFSEIKQKVVAEVKGKEIFNFLDLIDKYIKIKKQVVSESFLKKYITLKNHLLNFVKLKRKSFDLETIDTPFLDDFHSYLLIEKEMSNNTIRKNLQYFKTFLNWCLERDYTANTKFQKHKNPKQNDTDNIALSIDEFKSISTISLPDKLSKSRDVFLFQIYTGQRYSDILRFDYKDVKKEIDSDENVIFVWKLLQQKTKKIIEIPLFKPALDILNKYNNALPLKSLQKINNDLKEIGKNAGLDELVSVTKYAGSNTTTNRIPKYQLLTTHVARRTFVTMLSNANVNQQVVKALTGHGTDRMISKYYKTNAIEINNAISGVFSN